MSDTTTPPKPVAVPAETIPTVDRKLSPQFVIAVMLIVLIYFIVVMVFLRSDPTLINTVTSLTIGTVLGSLTGFYFGSSTSSQRKDIAPLPPAGGTSTITTTSTPNVDTTAHT